VFKGDEWLTQSGRLSETRMAHANKAGAGGIVFPAVSETIRFRKGPLAVVQLTPQSNDGPVEAVRLRYPPLFGQGVDAHVTVHAQH